MARLTESLSVKQIADEIIATVPAHKHLKTGKPDIVCLLREGTWNYKGKTVYAKVYKADAKVKAVARVDIFLVVNKMVWEALDDFTRRALIDHELCHITWDSTPNGDLRTDEDGRPIWTLVPHDYEDFVGVIKRHGMWTSDAKRFFKQTADYVQLDLFPKDEAAAADEDGFDVDVVFDITFDEHGRPIFSQKESDVK